VTWTSSSSKGPAETIARLEALDPRRQPVFVQLGLGHGGRQPAPVDDRNARVSQAADHPGEAAEVVLVPVRDHDRLDRAAPLLQVGEVGQDEVDPVHLCRGEAHACVDDHDAALVLDDGHVLADLAQSAERQDAKRGLHAASLGELDDGDGGIAARRG
jgi:hypothetical protein